MSGLSLCHHRISFDLSFEGSCCPRFSNVEALWLKLPSNRRSRPRLQQGAPHYICTSDKSLLCFPVMTGADRRFPHAVLRARECDASPLLRLFCGPPGSV